MSGDVYHAREVLLSAALRALSAERGQDDAHYAAELDYSYEQLALAARELTRATDALPAGKRPVGWGGESG
jgi:hypothetical protein